MNQIVIRRLDKIRFTALISLAILGGGITIAALQPPPESNDQRAWERLVEASGPITTTHSETSIGWRYWATSLEAYRPSTNPQPAGLQDLPDFCKSPLQNPQNTALLGQCEAVFLSPAVTGFVAANGLSARESVIALAASRFELPAQSIEIKTEWVPISVLPPNPPSTDYVIAQKNGSYFALVAFHMKARDEAGSEWLWATWIHKTYLDKVPRPTSDSFRFPSGIQNAENPAFGLFLEKSQSAKLNNYFLIGTQTESELAQKPLLGNPLIEGPHDPGLQKSSCVACHSHASIYSSGITGPFTNDPYLAPPNPDPSVPLYSLDQDFAVLKSNCSPQAQSCNQGVYVFRPRKSAK